MNVLSRLVRRVPAVSIFVLLLLAISSAAQAVDNVQSGYAGADAGDWGGKGGAPIGPADGTCANMGAVGKVNLLSGFGFDLPLTATITGVAAYIKAGSSGGQNVGLQLASQAAVDPPTTVGTQTSFPTTDVGSGNCSTTVVTSNGPALSAWGSPVLTPAIVNASSFGLVFTKIVTSEVKVDAVCLQIAYTTDAGPAVQEECFATPPPPSNTIRVIKEVDGAAPGADWAFTGEAPIGGFTLAAAGGFQDFTDLADDTFTITETTKSGYEASVECRNSVTDALVTSGTNSVNVPVSGNATIICTFVNTLVGSFTVNKDFTDDATGSVGVTLTCTSGTITDNTLSASEASPAVFEIKGYNAGATCTATESVPFGYTGDDSDCQDDDTIGVGVCTIVNTPLPPVEPASRTTFTVQKNFSDGNTDQDVTINIQCFTGLPLNQSQTVNPDNAGQFEVEFVVESFDQGTLDCNVFEDEVDGYTGSYVADSTVSPDFGSTDEGCYYNDIDTTEAPVEQNLCTITNDPNPVEVYVTKDWVIDGTGGDQLDPGYELNLFCYAGEILGGQYDSYWGGWYKELYDSNSNGTENTTYTAAVIPDWDGDTQCYAWEYVYDNSVEADDYDCDNNGFSVDIGDADGADGCTITNTVFYEGIPTLSQYGMAILALLMLGVGFVGFRRFV